MSVSKMVSAKKLGSKLAKGVRQVMEQKVKSPPAADVEGVSKTGPARVLNKPQVQNRDDAYKILHPDRVWPD